MIRLLYIPAITLLTSLTLMTPALAEVITQTGKVVESMNASGYTYMHVDTAGEDLWVAIPETAVEKGQQVSLAEGMVMKDFYSKTLDRTFASVIFSSGIVGSPAAQAQPASSSGDDGSSVSSESSFADAVKKESQQQPESQPQSSAGSAGATVPFLEVKVTKNFLYLVVTTTESISTDTVILIEGTVAANKDFGFGYKYDVLIEEATLLTEK